MFTNHLPDDEDYQVLFSQYAQRHFIKDFAKKYKGRRWLVTQTSILQDLKRLRFLQQTQQVDELMYHQRCWLFKYDFAVAQTNISPKRSGNRCLVFLDSLRYIQTVLLVYNKSKLPKNQAETIYLKQLVKTEFREFWAKLINNS